MSNTILTVGDLRKLIEGAPDDMPIYKEYDCDTVECFRATRGYQTVSRIRWQDRTQYVEHLQVEMIYIE